MPLTSPLKRALVPLSPVLVYTPDFLRLLGLPEGEGGRGEDDEGGGAVVVLERLRRD